MTREEKLAKLKESKKITLEQYLLENVPTIFEHKADTHEELFVRAAMLCLLSEELAEDMKGFDNKDGKFHEAASEYIHDSYVDRAYVYIDQIIAIHEEPVSEDDTEANIRIVNKDELIKLLKTEGGNALTKIFGSPVSIGEGFNMGESFMEAILKRKKKDVVN